MGTGAHRSGRQVGRVPARLDSAAMESRDRLANLGLFAAAAAAWVLVGIVVTTRDPVTDPVGGLIGAGLIGLALGTLSTPLFWLAVFARHQRIAFRGDWLRAIRRGAWVAVVAALFVALRLQAALSLPIAGFVVIIVFVAEATLSADR